MGIVKLGEGRVRGLLIRGEGRRDLPLRGRGCGLASLERRLGNGVGGGVGRFANRPYGGMDSGLGAGMMGRVGRYEEPAHTGERVALARM